MTKKETASKAAPTLRDTTELAAALASMDNPAVREQAVTACQTALGYDAIPGTLESIVRAVSFKRIHENAVLPRYATIGSAAFDLFPTEGGHIAPGSAMTFGTGFVPEIPPGYCMKIYSRSGQGFNHNVSLVNSVGIIDSDYRAEIKVGLRNDDHRKAYEVKLGVAIAQAIIEPVEQWLIHEVTEVSDTERGEGGFGSTDLLPEGAAVVADDAQLGQKAD